MHTWQSDKMTINYNSDLSGDAIITTDSGELEVDMNEIARFLIARIWYGDGETHFLEKLIADSSNDISAISIEASEKIGNGVKVTTIRKVSGDQNG